MSGNTMRVVTTKLGKQLSGYFLLSYDMNFATRVFGLAAMRSARSALEQGAGRLSAEDRARIFQALDPMLRQGAVIAQLDEDTRNESEVEKSALFETGIIIYGRCFNSGLRTHLSKDMFTGKFLKHKKLHESMMEVRNKHIAHSELKMEQSIIGFKLINDPNYGKRPSMVLGALAMRRYYPTDDRLIELESHCRNVAENIIQPKLLEIGRALREQLLQMPPEQLEQFPEFGSLKPTLDELL